jgi:outer membrane protein OmpA-like peptidoglycan-associated protein
MGDSMRKLLAICLSVLWLAACTTDPYTGEKRVSRTAIGAGVGALAGAGIGALAGDGKGAAIGAGVGALAGGAAGAYMDHQAKKLREELAGTGVSVTKVGDNIILNMPGNVTFATDQGAIQSSFYPTLNSAGHTDSTGGYEYNLKLSQERADSVASYLAAQGVQSARLVSRGYGPDRPLGDNGTVEGRQQNRRVEITLEPITA